MAAMRMESRESLEQDIRAMAANCSVCERDALDAQERLGVRFDFEHLAHPEDSFAYDLLPHRQERHREKLLKKIEQWASLAPTSE
jgi:hypothetical protein